MLHGEYVVQFWSIRRGGYGSHKYNTAEEIWHEDAGVYTMGTDQLRALISRVLSKVPKDVANRVFYECTFLMPMYEYEFGFYLSKELL